MNDPENNSKLLAPVTHTVSINPAREKLWELLATPGVVEICHPFCKHPAVERWPGGGSRDRLIY
jgi:hypothetical protein